MVSPPIAVAHDTAVCEGGKRTHRRLSANVYGALLVALRARMSMWAAERCTSKMRRDYQWSR